MPFIDPGDIEDPSTDVADTFSDDFNGDRILNQNMYGWNIYNGSTLLSVIRYTTTENPVAEDSIYGLVTMLDLQGNEIKGFYVSANWDVYSYQNGVITLNNMLLPTRKASTYTMVRNPSEDVITEPESEVNGLFIGETQITPVESILANKKKYNTDINSILGDVDVNGVLQKPIDEAELIFTGVKDIDKEALLYKFYMHGLVKNVSFPELTTLTGESACYSSFASTPLTSVSFPLLTTISGDNSCQQMFQACHYLTSVSLPLLTSITGEYACSYMFDASALTSVPLPSLTTISGERACYSMFIRNSALTNATIPLLTTISGNYACYYMFRSCKSLKTISFPKLTSITGEYACYYMFGSCASMEDIYFPALTTTSFGSYTNQFQYMLQDTGSTKNHTLHFPSNLESTIQGLSGYPLFGGTNGYVTLSFDLPTTE